MRIKNPGFWILVFGPAVVLAIVFVPTLNYYGRDLWIPIWVSIGFLIPILGGVLIGWRRKYGLGSTLLYFPLTGVTSFIYAILRANFDPSHHGAAEASVGLFMTIMIAALVGTAVALTSAAMLSRD